MSVANERTSEAKCPQGGAKGGMTFGAHEPPRTRLKPRPCRANPHGGGAPTNAALKGGIPESVSSRSIAESGISWFIVGYGTVTQCNSGVV